MNPRVDNDAGVTEDAARWLSALLDGNERRTEFFAWLEESPRHVEEFLFVLADAQDLALLSDDQRARIEALSGELGTDAPAGSNVVFVSPRARPEVEPRAREQEAPEIPAVAAAGTRNYARRLGMAIAATLVLTIAGATWWLTGPGAWTTYTTKVGEQRTLELTDGSVVDLNTDSTVAVRLTDTSRNIRLIRGEALFSVERDPRRPFLVHTSNAVIQAIGTRFNVHRRADRTRVAVIEGLVQVSEAGEGVSASTREPPPPARARQETAGAANASADTEPGHAAHVQLLSAGEATEVMSGGEVARPHAFDAERAIAWRQRRLVFEDATLREIADEFNRYNATVKIRVLGEAAAQENYSGTFDADAPEAMMQALAGDPALHVERVGHDIVIREREPREP